MSESGGSSDLSRQTQFVAGDIIGGDYEVLSFIGAGGMGDVYKVRHMIMQTEYALKTLHQDKVTEKAWMRFQTEAQAIARMNHPNIVAIYNLGVHQDRLPFYVMEILLGKTLQDLLHDKGRLPLKRTLAIFIDVCAGLGYAHKKGIVHRDMKPPNIVILDKADASGSRLKIVDFGIAKLTATTELSSQQMTRAGEVCGSPYYMSPEQCEAGTIDARSDIYSLGCTLFETLTGRPPFTGRTAVDTMLMHQGTKPPTLRSACPIPMDELDDYGPTATRFPQMLEMIMATMLAKAPQDRYQNMERVIKDLRTIYHQEFGQANTISPGTTEDLRALPQVKRAGGADQPELFENDSAQANREASQPQTSNLRLPLIVFSSVIAIVFFVGLVVFGIYKSNLFGGAPTDNGNIGNSGGGTTKIVSPSLSALPVGTPFSRLVTRGSDKFVLFDFPAEGGLGQLEYTDKDGKHIKKCTGHFEVNMADKPIYRAGLTMVQHPEYFKRFDPQSLYGIDLQSTIQSEDFNDTTIEAILHMRSLESLVIYGCPNVSDASLKKIEVFTKLRYLSAIDTKINILTLAHYPRLRQLNGLVFYGDDSLSPLLRALQGSQNIQELDFRRSSVTLQDYQSLGTLTNLHKLFLDRCFTSDNDLAAMSALTHLSTMHLEDNRLTEVSLPILQKMITEAPRELRCRSKYWTPRMHEMFSKFKAKNNLNWKDD